MTIELPKFEGKYGLSLTVCGRLKNNKKKTVAADEERPKVARYRVASGQAYFRAWLAEARGRHLHIDCALGKSFPEKSKPKVTHRKDVILKAVRDLIGQEIDTSVRAYYKIPLVDLPESSLVRSISVEREVGEAGFKINECGVSFSRMPIKKIKWLIKKKGKTNFVHIHMEGERQTKVSEKYLVESWEWINELFKFFVLGNVKDAKD